MVNMWVFKLVCLLCPHNKHFNFPWLWPAGPRSSVKKPTKYTTSMWRLNILCVCLVFCHWIHLLINRQTEWLQYTLSTALFAGVFKGLDICRYSTYLQCTGRLQTGRSLKHTGRFHQYTGRYLLYMVHMVRSRQGYIGHQDSPLKYT